MNRFIPLAVFRFFGLASHQPFIALSSCITSTAGYSFDNSKMYPCVIGYSSPVFSGISITGGSAATCCSEHIVVLDSYSDLDSDWIGLRTHLLSFAVKCPQVAVKKLLSPTLPIAPPDCPRLTLGPMILPTFEPSFFTGSS